MNQLGLKFTQKTPQTLQMKNALFVLLFFFTFQISNAQDLHIYYDVTEDSIFYLKNGQPTKEAVLKKGEKAVLHVINYNDYIYDVRVNTSSRDYKIPSSGVGKIFSVGGEGSGAFQQLKDAASNFGIPGFQISENSISSDRDGAANAVEVSAEVKRLSAQFTSILKDMRDIEEEIEDIGEDIETDIQSQEFNAFKAEEAASLRTNPNLSPKQIKKISLEYMEEILGVKGDKKFDLEDLFEKSDPKKIIGNQIKDYKTETERLEAEFTKLSTTNKLLAASQLPLSDQASFLSSFTAAENRKNSYQEKVEQMEEQIEQIGQWDIKELSKIRYLYEEMKEHKFEKKIILSPEDDLTQIRISLTPIDSAQIEGAKTLQLNPLQVSVFGGLKINASVGISFASFFNRPQFYSTREDRIIADDLDPFTPIVTSFIHFHPQSKNQVSLGGAFGLGIGIGGETSGLQTYFLGPSLIIGKTQRIVFTSGLMAGKVDRLAQGFSVGDAYSESIVPIKSVYEMGYFLGISFNFLGN